MGKQITWVKDNPWVLVPILLLGYYLYSQLFNALAQRHFDAHCENDAGEFIYKTVDNVEGVFQMRPRDPTKYYFDNLRHYQAGTDELLEDPFGHTDSESQRPHILFVSYSNNYSYLETTKAPNTSDDRYSKVRLEKNDNIIDLGGKYWIYRGTRHVSERDRRYIYSVKNSDHLLSQYGFTWQEVRNKWDNFFDIWGGELIVKDLKTDETLAIRRGYFSFKYGICPRDKDSWITYKFISKVLKPSNKAGSDNQGEQ